MMVKVPEKFLMMRSWFIAFNVMILAVITALLLTRVLLPVFDPSVFTLFYAAVAVSAWYGGMRLGVLAIALICDNCSLFFNRSSLLLRFPQPESSGTINHILTSILLNYCALFRIANC